MTFAATLREDQTNIVVFIASSIGFLVGVAGLGSLPLGSDESKGYVPDEDLKLNWFAFCFSLVAGAMVIAGSGLRRRDLLLMGLILTTSSAALLTLSSHFLTELTGHCRTGEESSTKSRCLSSYSASTVGASIVLVCQYIFLFTATDRRKKIKESFIKSDATSSSYGHGGITTTPPY
eukprot:GFYU01003862.1.p1 GENE.GFYU01003862.1~~GFYU01003862.1.p1  ORF type:complete len:177 (-),score=29.79 GFYU01003862.1:163-693(-)